MRVTQRMMTGNAIRHMNENSQRLLALQEKVASGKEFQRPSDNPSGAAAALSLRSSLEANKAYLNTAQVVEDWYSANELALSGMLTIGKRAIQLTLSGVSDSMGQAERDALAVEVNELLAQAVEAGNTSHAGNFIFNGYRTGTAPFTLVDGNSDGTYESVTSNGNAGETILRNVGPAQAIPQNVDGHTIFQPLFQALITARDALSSGSSAAIQSAAGELQTRLNQVSEANTVNGARQRQVGQIQVRMEKAQIELKSLLSQKGDANLTEAISNLRYQETVYQAVLEVGQRAISALSLFDMLS